jgi:hypothetical protein
MTRSHAHVILSQPNPNESLTAQKVPPLLKSRGNDRNRCWRGYISFPDQGQLI